GSNRIKALSAAYAGLNFYQGLLLATTTTFDRTDWNSCRERFHFLARAPIAQLNNALYPGRQIATSTVGALAAVGDAWYNGFIHVATAQWLFASDPAIIPTDFDVPSSSLFIIKTYVASPAAGIASYVYVKSLGCYREIQNDEIVASYYAQLLARIEISTVTSTLSINRLMQMPLEYPFCATAPFFASMPVPWK
ncbi:MAG TPA: hypothetical protein PKO06_17400, partial [Candidatus Ozemobacteraceae bacterium]|nr:hypothetical protein [Candidatus Ozemobacteraceae bacterium]